MLCLKTSSSEISFYSEWARKIGKSEINIWKPSTLIVLWLWWAYMETKPCLRQRSPCFRLLLVNWLHVSIHTFTLLAIQDIGKSRMDFICGTAAIQLIHCLFQNRTSKALTMASNQRERCKNFWCSIHGNNWHCCTCNRSSLIMILLFSLWFTDPAIDLWITITFYMRYLIEYTERCKSYPPNCASDCTLLTLIKFSQQMNISIFS